MLKNIPFYASLLDRELASGKRSTNSYVLVYGAIEAHSFGPKGCVASNRTIAKETGLKEGSVATIISLLAKSRWLKVNLDLNNHRTSVEPLMVIEPPSIGVEPPLQSGLNIDNSNIGNNSAAEAANAPKQKEESEILKLFYLVVKKYGLPVTNHNHIRKWARDLEAMPDSQSYLQRLLDDDIREAEGDFKPTLNSAFDVIQKKLKVQRFYNGGEDSSPELDPRVFGAPK